MGPYVFSARFAPLYGRGSQSEPRGKSAIFYQRASYSNLIGEASHATLGAHDPLHSGTGPAFATIPAIMSTLRLMQFTDTHLYGSATESLRGVQTLPALKRALACARMRDWPVDAMLVTGDIVQDDPAGYAHFRKLFADFGVPVLCVPGNHDDPAAMRRELTGKPFVLGGVVDMAAWRIVLLDSCVAGSAGGKLSAAALVELDRALAGAPQRHVMVCLHHHPVAMDSRWLDQVGLENGEEFWAVLGKHRNVRAVTWGHVHQAFDSLRKGVRLLATPSTCAQFIPHAEQFAVDSQPPAYRTFELKPDGTLETEVVWIDREWAARPKSSSSAA
jgi:Icc protein